MRTRDRISTGLLKKSELRPAVIYENPNIATSDFFSSFLPRIGENQRQCFLHTVIYVAAVCCIFLLLVLYQADRRTHAYFTTGILLVFFELLWSFFFIMSTTIVFSAKQNNNVIFHDDRTISSSSFDMMNAMQYSVLKNMNNEDPSSSMKHIGIPIIFFRSPTYIKCNEDDSVRSHTCSSTIDHTHLYYINRTTLSLINSIENNTITTNELTFIIKTTTMTPSNSCYFDSLPEENVLSRTESILAFTRLLLILWTNRNIQNVSIVNHIITNDDTYIESQAYIVSRILDSICMSTTIHDVGLYGIVSHTLALVRLLRFARSLKALRLDSCSIVEQLKKRKQQQTFVETTITSPVVSNNNNVEKSSNSSVMMPSIHNGQNNSNSVNDNNMNSSTYCFHDNTTEEHQLDSFDHTINLQQHQDQQHQRHSQVGTSIDNANRFQQQQQAATATETTTTSVMLPLDLCFAFMDSRIEILEIHEKYELNIAHILRNIAGEPISHIRHVKLYPITCNNDTNSNVFTQRSFDYVNDAIRTLIEESNTIQQIDLIGFNYVHNNNVDCHHYDDMIVMNNFPLDTNLIDQFLIPKSIQINFDLCHFTDEQYQILCKSPSTVTTTATTATMNRRQNAVIVMDVDNTNEIAFANHDDSAIEANLRQQQRQRTVVPNITISCSNLIWTDKDWYQPTTMLSATDEIGCGNHFILDNEGKCQALARILHKSKMDNRQITLELITYRLPKNQLSFKGKNYSSTKQKLLHSLKRNSTICQVTLIDNGTTITNGINHFSYFDYEHDFKLIQYVCYRNEKIFDLLISTIVGRRYYHHDMNHNDINAKNNTDNHRHGPTTPIIQTINNENSNNPSTPLSTSIVPKLLELVMDCDDGPNICHTILQAM